MLTGSRLASVVAAGTLLLAGASGCATVPPSQATPSQATPDLAPRTTAAPDAGASSTPSRPRRTSRPSPVPSAIEVQPSTGSARGVLATLRVRGRAPMTGYSRDAFGPAWPDANRNGCDERNDILARDLENRTEENCRILTGTLTDPYTAEAVPYRYGDGTLVDIDHVVALGNAWVSGAARWPIRRRAALATDPLNLLAVDASANRQKSDADAATWLPPNKAYRCAYVARQVGVKAKFALSVTAPEKAAIARVLDTCPEQRLPPDPGSPLLVDHQITEPSTTATSPSTPASGGAPTPYENCDAVRAAGAAPLHAGEPGYSSRLDGDGDGSACE